MVEGSEATIFPKTSFTVLISFLSYLARDILFDQSPWTLTLARFSDAVMVYNYYYVDPSPDFPLPGGGDYKIRYSPRL